jgi:hypothetical protein
MTASCSKSEASRNFLIRRGRDDDSCAEVTVIARSVATKQSSLSARGVLDCFAEPVFGPAKPDPLARNDVVDRYPALACAGVVLLSP